MMEPACQACREPRGTCFPGPCKIYSSVPARERQRLRLLRSAVWQKDRAICFRKMADQADAEAKRLLEEANALTADG